METNHKLSSMLPTSSDSFISTIKKVSLSLDYAQFMEILCDSQEEVDLLNEKELSLSWGNKHLKEFLFMKSDFCSWFVSTTEDHRNKFLMHVEMCSSIDRTGLMSH